MYNTTLMHRVVHNPSMDDIAFSEYLRDSRLVFKVIGSIDDYSIGQFQARLLDAAKRSTGLLILDLSFVPFMCSEGFGIMINTQKSLLDSGRSMALVGCQKSVKSALELTRIDMLLPCYPSIYEIPQA